MASGQGSGQARAGAPSLQLAAKGASKSAEPSELLAANGADKLVRVLRVARSCSGALRVAARAQGSRESSVGTFGRETPFR